MVRHVIEASIFSLPIVFSDVDEYSGDGRSKENLLVVLAELLAVDVHVQLEFNILRTFDLLQQLDHGFVITHLSTRTSVLHR